MSFYPLFEMAFARYVYQPGFHTLWIRVRRGVKPLRKAICGVTFSTKAMAGEEFGSFI